MCAGVYEGVHTRVHAHVCIKARGQCMLSSSTAPQLNLELTKLTS